MQTLNKNEGLITQIIGPVIDIEFQQGELPEIYNALNITMDDGTVVVAEVQQMLGSNRVRTVAQMVNICDICFISNRFKI